MPPVEIIGAGLALAGLALGFVAGRVTAQKPTVTEPVDGARGGVCPPHEFDTISGDGKGWRCGKCGQPMSEADPRMYARKERRG